MDTSETYIKMCERAEEIQALADNYYDNFSISCWFAPNHVQCKGHFSDWHMKYKYCPVCKKPLKVTPEFSICLRMKGDENIWLPRQDQLQEMLSKHYASKMGMVDTVSFIKQVFIEFAVWLNVQYEEHPFVCVPTNIFDSGEQLWLAFVMKEKYGKTWDGNNWLARQ